MRTFRISRVRSVQVLDERVERPPGLDVDALWTETQARFLREQAPSGFHVTALVDPASADLLGRHADRWLEGPIAATGRPDGRLTARLDLNGPEHAMLVLAPFGGAVEVVTPSELRQHVRDHASAMLARHAD
jgi:predicted DNA-binding transcriptional regulator YafY